MKIISEGDHFVFDGDHEAFADWMLAVVDSSPDKLAVFPMPVGADDSDEEIDSVEDIVRRAYDIAKEQRPNLGVKLLHALDDRNGTPESRLLVVIHEHQWVGGQCVNGCPDTRKGD
jgi:hypothetical protein